MKHLLFQIGEFFADLFLDRREILAADEHVLRVCRPALGDRVQEGALRLVVVDGLIQ